MKKRLAKCRRAHAAEDAAIQNAVQQAFLSGICDALEISLFEVSHKLGHIPTADEIYRYASDYCECPENA
jgi:hypothetical protein